MQSFMDVENSCIREFVSKGYSIEDFGVILWFADHDSVARERIMSLSHGKILLEMQHARRRFVNRRGQVTEGK